jgi:hypothetical protein
VLRNAMPGAAADFKFARSTAVPRNVDAEGLAIAKHASEPSRSRRILDELRHDLPHPRRPFVSYPDQCCLTVLKRAMLLHLDM